MRNGTSPALSAGFANPVFDSQRVFRRLLEAMSYPGRIVAVDTDMAAPAPLGRATAAICLSLMDYETPVWLDPAAVDARDWLRFHCGSPIVSEAARALFAVVADPATMPALSAFDVGTDEYPDRSATLILQVSALDAGEALRLSGPGIRDRAGLSVVGLPARVWRDWADNRVLFPGGVDLILTCGDRLAALPRTVTVEV